MFTEDSRYANLTPYTVQDSRGRTVTVVPVPDPPQQTLLGYHLRYQGQRLDHLANKYLNDPTGFWRICEVNDVMQAEILSEAREIGIPEEQ